MLDALEAVAVAGATNDWSCVALSFFPIDEPPGPWPGLAEIAVLSTKMMTNDDHDGQVEHACWRHDPGATGAGPAR